ncbi:hypothetical protein [Amnibacterium endophyticum]|uniref:DUF4446 domain-containing protein n=1 Tax=Amnibacterium endophyticum TaxID=2109337 RepID=A0ABW4LIC2_9MICO
MSIESLLILGLMALLLVGAVATVVLIARASRPVAQVRLEANPMVARVTGEVHAGEEQTLIHLARTLGLPSGREDVAYGQIYLAGSAGTTMRLATRSEIGRGFDGEVRVRRTRRSSVVEYFVLRVPGDEAVLRRIEELDDRIADALVALDPHAQVQRTGQHRDPDPSAR